MPSSPLVLRRREAASKHAPGTAALRAGLGGGFVLASVLRGRFAAPQDEGGGRGHKRLVAKAAACAFLLSCAPAPALSPDLPADASEGSFAAMGDFAWRVFLALNWPSGSERGAPDRARSPADPGPRLWESFKSRAETFPKAPDGRRLAPSPWDSFAGPNPCGGDGSARSVAAFEPFAEFNQPGFGGEPANPLVAANGDYVRYEVRYNQTEFAVLTAASDSLPDAEHPIRFPVGSLAVKAAWRPLNGADAPATRARYYVVRADVLDVAATRAAGRPVCAARDLALVGFHIAVKTASRPQWIWASFEHADNVPPAAEGEPDAAAEGVPYGFFDPARPARLWPPFGAAGTIPLDAANPPETAPRPMQIVRRHPVNPALMAVNRAYWGEPQIARSVWRRYMLVAAQWPTSAEPPGPENDGAYFPGSPQPPREESYKSVAAAQENLVNTTLESFMQDAPSSCMACHHAAANADGFDFVATLARRR